jgi:copper chaperone NosL
MKIPAFLSMAFFGCACLLGQAPPPAGHMHMMPPMAAGEAVEAPEACLHCGMNRTAFAHSRMQVVYEDDTMAGTCSIHCTAIELDMNKQKLIKSLMVADYADKKKLIHARKAFWVIGGDVKGVMTMEPKWAFERREDAAAFVKLHGGRLANWEEVFELALREPRKH